MENKKNSKKTVKLLVVLIALLLIACSILGITLARYVTQGDPGTAGVNIAEWNIVSIDGTESGTGTAGVLLETFSPQLAKYKDNQSRSVGKDDVTILQIKNEGDVDAYVFLDFGTGLAAYGYNEDGSVSDTPIDFNVIDADKNQNDPESDYYYAPWGSQLNEIFSLGTLEYALEDAEGNSGPATAENDGDYRGAYLVPAGETLTVKTDITWKSDLTSDTGEFFTTVDQYDCVYADYRDTWIGENIAQVGYTYTWYAVQGSQLPTT